VIPQLKRTGVTSPLNEVKPGFWNSSHGIMIGETAKRLIWLNTAGHTMADNEFHIGNEPGKWKG
jgi:hypothetical protein